MEKAPPSGGVATWELGDNVKECALRGREIDLNLAFGALNIATKGKEMAVIRFLRSETKGEGQLAFGGHDNQTRSIATSHGLGKAIYQPTWLFPRKEEWQVFWFDPQGLAFTRSGWSANVNKIGRFPAMPLNEVDRINILSPTLDGPLVGVSPLSSELTAQLGIFLFSPGETSAEIVKAVGATHHAVRPKFPVVATSADGYFLAWVDELEAGKPTSVVVTRLDPNGKELGPQITVSTAGRAARQPALVVTDGGVLLAWTEKNGAHDDVVVQAIDKAWQPVGNAQRVEHGTSPALAAMPSGGAALTFLRRVAEGQPVHAAAVRVDSKGVPAARGILLSAPDKPKDSIKEPPAITLTEEGWLGVVFTFSDGMRAHMRTVKAECLAP